MVCSHRCHVQKMSHIAGKTRQSGVAAAGCLAASAVSWVAIAALTTGKGSTRQTFRKRARRTLTNYSTGAGALCTDRAAVFDGSVVATGGSDEERECLDIDNAVQGGSIYDKRRDPPSAFVRINQMLQWHCPHCPFVGERPVGTTRFCKRIARQLHGVRDGHLRRYHEGQPRTRGVLALQFVQEPPEGGLTTMAVPGLPWRIHW